MDSHFCSLNARLNFMIHRLLSSVVSREFVSLFFLCSLERPKIHFTLMIERLGETLRNLENRSLITFYTLFSFLFPSSSLPPDIISQVFSSNQTSFHIKIFPRRAPREATKNGERWRDVRNVRNYNVQGKIIVR